MIDATCDLCGISFKRYPSRIRDGLQFCSNQCRQRSYRDPRLAPLISQVIVDRHAVARARVQPPYEVPVDVARIDWSDRFWSKVSPEALTGCWIWLGAVDSKGYGAFTPPTRRMIGAHRHALALRLGRALRAEELACHRCDVPLCVNPSHLFIGSAAENQQDCVKKGRKNPLRGESAPGAKLTDATVMAVRAAFGLGTETQRSIAARFGLSYQHVNAIVNGRVWAHLPVGLPRAE